MNKKLKDFIRPFLNKNILDEIHSFNWKLFFKRNLRKQYSEFEKEFSIIHPNSKALNSFNIKKPKIILDIGAHYGEWSFFLSKKYPDSKIFSFEPTLRSFNILKRNINKYMGNVAAFNIALGDIETYSYLNTSKDSGLNHISKDKTENKIKVVCLDNFINKKNISRVDFIKCDVEGFEMNVFKGAEKTIKKFKPIIFCEINPTMYFRYGINEKEIMDFFKKMNYKIYGIKDKLIKTEKITSLYEDYLFIPIKK